MPAGIDRRLLYNVDWVLAGAAVALALVGVAMVYSATHSSPSAEIYLKQLALIGARPSGGIPCRCALPAAILRATERWGR